MRLFRIGTVGALWGLLAVCAWAGPVWRSDLGGLPETDIRSIVAGAGQAGLWAASPRHVYRYVSKTQTWKRLAAVRTPDEIVEMLPDPSGPEALWLATRRTIRRSTDGGRSWKVVFRRDSESGFQIRTIGLDGEALVAGTTAGLYRLDSRGGWRFVEGSPKNTAVDSLALSGSHWLVGTARGIYRVDRQWQAWELLDAELRRETVPPDEALGQFAVEEIATTSQFANAVSWPADGRVFIGRGDGVLMADPKKPTLSRVPEAEGFRVRRLAADEKFVYLATDRGVYRFSPSTRSIENISQGLESLDVLTVSADAKEGIVYAGTRKGLFRLKPFEGPVPEIRMDAGRPEAAQRPFGAASEPTILEIQRAAVAYADVSPEKIQAWRAAASRKAWLPTVSFDTDFGRNQNVDLDRGGTNDPDRFIIGPEEKTVDWSVDFSWDLGDLIWNDDQTSIDVRSRLMVELRNDILNDVTHLYFERRRLQAELAALPADVPGLRFEKELKLQELTAQIDALTGNTLSRRLAGEERNA